jgi:hypothetical protein
MQYILLISEGFSQAHHASGIPQINGSETPLTKVCGSENGTQPAQKVKIGRKVIGHDPYD